MIILDCIESNLNVHYLSGVAIAWSTVGIGEYGHAKLYIMVITI